MEDVEFETPKVAVENVEPQVPEFAEIEDPTESPLPAEVKVQSFSDKIAPIGNI